MKFISLFAGIGGLDLGLERSGMECVAQVEIDDYARRVLAKHWPDVPKFTDVREVGRDNLPDCDLICGGFPCQDISNTGKQAGIDGERSGLWSEYFRTICELRPRYVLIENVAALLNRGMSRVLGDLASCGYDAEWQVLRASDFGAPHRRDRLFIIAYPDEVHGEARMGDYKNGARPIFAQGNRECFPIWLQAADRFVGMDDGIPAKLYEARGGGLGNAVVPQVAEYIGKQIMARQLELAA